MKKEEEQRILHRMAKVHYFMEMWRGSENIHATRKGSRSHNKLMTAGGYISAMEEIINPSWPLFQLCCVAAFTLSVRSPLSPAMSATDLPGGRTQIFNVRQITRINVHPVKSDENSATECISDTENWLARNRNLEIPNDSKDNFTVDIESDIEHDNCMEHPECSEQWDVSAAPNVPGMILQTRKLKRQAGNVLVMVHAMETRRNKQIQKT